MNINIGFKENKRGISVNSCNKEPFHKKKVERERERLTYRRKETGTIPARYSAILRNMGMARSKWGLGGLHQPPLSLGRAKLGGQKLVAVTMMEGLPGLHHLGSSLHLISKHAPQLRPLLKSAVLSAAVFTP